MEPKGHDAEGRPVWMIGDGEFSYVDPDTIQPSQGASGNAFIFTGWYEV